MSKSEAKKSLTVVLNDKQEDNQSDNTYERYIIDNNKRLQEENTCLKLSVNSLEDRIEELEEDTATEEKRNQYLKSLLKNFNEIHKNTQELNSIEYKINKKHYYLIAETVPILVLLTSMLFGRMWYLTPLFTTLGTVGVKIRHAKSTSELYKSKNRIENEIKDIEKGQDYIYEFIDKC